MTTTAKKGIVKKERKHEEIVNEPTENAFDAAMTVTQVEDQRPVCNEHGVSDCVDCSIRATTHDIEGAAVEPGDGGPVYCTACRRTEGHEDGCPEASEDESDGHTDNDDKHRD